MSYKESVYNIKIKMRGGKRLMYNSLSRALCLLEPEDVALLEQLKDNDHDDNFGYSNAMQHFMEQGFVLPGDTDEIGVVKNLYESARYNPNAINFVVCSTLACNFGCDYCFQGADKPLTAMSKEVQDEVVHLYEKMLKARPEIQQINMIWYGGEPLMRKQVLYDMADKLIDISARSGVNYTASMVTNGFMLTREVALELFKRGLKSVQITLDGSEAFHDARRHLLSDSKKGTYWKIMKNLREWIDEIPMAVSIRVNIDERNKDAIVDLMDDLAERQLAGKRNLKIYFSPVESNTTGCHNVSELTMKKMEYGQLEATLYRYAFQKGLADLPYPTRFLGICSALRPNDYILVPNGDVHKCWDTVSYPEKRVGTVFDTDALFKMSNPHHQLWEAFDPFQNDICRSCKILPNCTSYCAHKFVYAADSAGESVLPCPSIKYSLNEQLVLKAEMDGFITREDYDPEEVKTNPYELTPQMHTVESMTQTSRSTYIPLPVIRVAEPV